MEILATENSTSTSAGAAVTFQTTLNGTKVPVERMRIDQNGNVGIGWTSPSTKLSVAGGIHISARVGTENTLTGVVLPMQGAYIGWNEDNGIGMTSFMNHRGIGGGGFNFSLFDTNGSFLSTPMTIYANGNIGIGTTTPAQKLSVAGTIESTSGGFKFPDGTTQTTAATAGGL